MSGRMAESEQRLSEEVNEEGVRQWRATMETYHARQRANAAENAQRATPPDSNTPPASTMEPLDPPDSREFEQFGDAPALVSALLEKAWTLLRGEARYVASTDSYVIPFDNVKELFDAARALREARGETP